MITKILATLCVTMFVLAALATVQQVAAHYTLGDQLPGKIGETTAGGLPVSPTNVAGNGQPRFHTPKDFGGHAPGHIAFLLPGSLYVPPSDQRNYYSPDGAILTDTVGDFFLYICVADNVTGDTAITHAGQAGPINISWRRENPPTSPQSSRAC